MSRPDLPDFTNPPVHEVVLSIQFQPLSELRAIHLGSLWERFGKKTFTSVEEQPPMPRTFERFGGVRQFVVPQFEILNMAPLQRFVFISRTGTEVVQLQKDRFSFNWRKRSSSDVYPRYESIEAQFVSFEAAFEEFLREEKLGIVKIEQAEVIYVNQIPAAELGNRAEKVISILSGNYTDSYLREPEEVRLSLTFPMLRDKTPYGRLHVEAFGSTQADAPALNLALVARGKPFGTDINAATEFFRAGRAFIVNGFASITSKEMHKIWGRTDDTSSHT
jgi:uncharacterized protein (TIGR04255 family)